MWYLVSGTHSSDVLWAQPTAYSNGAARYTTDRTSRGGIGGGAQRGVGGCERSKWTHGCALIGSERPGLSFLCRARKKLSLARPRP